VNVLAVSVKAAENLNRQTGYYDTVQTFRWRLVVNYVTLKVCERRYSEMYIPLSPGLC
jgi:hypothetical protein